VNRLEIKICGLTHADDALDALEAGADFLGFVLYAKSRRHLTPSALERLRRRLPREARCVGVFVNATPAAVAKVMRECGLYAAQVCGEESAADFAKFRLRLWRVVRSTKGRWAPNPGEWKAERFVVDAPGPQYGGTGECADWNRAGVLARARPVMLAGGLTPLNVAEAVRVVRPAGVDVASGVEAVPGRKDPVKVRLFIQAARAAFVERDEEL
jgi:phosphoribosylanthranilate isomerase